MDVIAVIPAFNESETIGEVVRETKKHVKDVLVIDDCSADDTAKVARDAGAMVISHVINRGWGAATRTGHLYAIRNGYDYLVQLDGDKQHDPKYIPRMLKLARKYDVVIGSRFLTKSYKRYSLIRRAGIRFFTFMINLVGTTPITDVTSGYRVYKVSRLKTLSRFSDRHPAVEQMLDMQKKGFRIKEIPMHMPTRKTGTSHLNLKAYILYPWRAFTNSIKVLVYK